MLLDRLITRFVDIGEYTVDAVAKLSNRFNAVEYTEIISNVCPIEGSS